MCRWKVEKLLWGLAELKKKLVTNILALNMPAFPGMVHCWDSQVLGEVTLAKCDLLISKHPMNIGVSRYKTNLGNQNGQVTLASLRSKGISNARFVVFRKLCGCLFCLVCHFILGWRVWSNWPGLQGANILGHQGFTSQTIPWKPLVMPETRAATDLDLGISLCARIGLASPSFSSSRCNNSFWTCPFQWTFTRETSKSVVPCRSSSSCDLDARCSLPSRLSWSFWEQGRCLGYFWWIWNFWSQLRDLQLHESDWKVYIHRWWAISYIHSVRIPFEQYDRVRGENKVISNITWLSKQTSVDFCNCVVTCFESSIS